MALADDVARLTSILVRQHQGGQAAALRRSVYGSVDRDHGLSLVAKVCGTSPSVVQAWEDGAASPTTQQGLAWLAHLYEAQPVAERVLA